MKTKHVQYQTHGTCSQLIDVTADEHDVIQQVFFLGGCNGNLQGISQLVRGHGITGSVLLIIFRSLISLCFITCLIRISFNLKKRSEEPTP